MVSGVLCHPWAAEFEDEDDDEDDDDYHL